MAGNENLEAIDFLKHLNGVVHERFPGVLMMAEESTAWPMVSRPVHLGGLGFSMKWNMGWMNDTLDYIGKDPIHRKYHHDKLTFGLLYAFTENFILPFSHDEVVHGKRSLLYKMPGDEWQRFASLRLLLTYQFTQPGKKLNFMTNDIAQGREWNHDRELEWYLLQYPFHQGVQRLVADLNRLYRNEPALHRHDFDSSGFEWIDCHDSTQSVLSFLRKSDQGWLLVLLNFTPVVREDYRVGVPAAGSYRELFNSNSRHYGGSDLGNGQVVTEPVAWMGRPVSLRLTLPPLAGIVLRLA
jgi:1,4-alpha-glucan branching enzyme